MVGGSTVNLLEQEDFECEPSFYTLRRPIFPAVIEAYSDDGQYFPCWYAAGDIYIL